MAPNDQVKLQIQSTLKNLTEIASNSLAIVKGIATVLSSLKIPGFPTRRLLSDPEDELQSLDDEFPKWLPAGDRMVLQNSTVTPNVIVASDGTGKYMKIQEAVDAAPDNSKTRYVIMVKQGTYRENVVVPSGKPLITIIGEGMNKTIILGNRNVVDNSTTFASATLGKLTNIPFCSPPSFSNQRVSVFTNFSNLSVLTFIFTVRIFCQWMSPILNNLRDLATKDIFYCLGSS